MLNMVKLSCDFVYILELVQYENKLIKVSIDSVCVDVAKNVIISIHNNR